MIRDDKLLKRLSRTIERAITVRDRYEEVGDEDRAQEMDEVLFRLNRLA